jgi:hypothetical protein
MPRAAAAPTTHPRLTPRRPSPPPLPPAVVRTDGPPFVDIKAKQGKGFEVDYDTVCKHLGAGRVRAAARATEGAGRKTRPNRQGEGQRR